MNPPVGELRTHNIELNPPYLIVRARMKIKERKGYQLNISW